MLRILLVGGNELVRMAFRHLVAEERRRWWICGEAADADLGAALAKRLRPSVAILGPVEGDLEEAEVTRRIREASPGTQVLILADQVSDGHAPALSAGARTFVAWTEGAHQLIAAVDACAEADAQRRPVAALVAEPRDAVGHAVPPQSLVLTALERSVAQLVAQGRSTWCIAAILALSEETIEAERGNLMRKLGLRSTVELVHYAVRTGLIEIDRWIGGPV